MLCLPVKCFMNLSFRFKSLGNISEKKKKKTLEFLRYIPLKIGYNDKYWTEELVSVCAAHSESVATALTMPGAPDLQQSWLPAQHSLRESPGPWTWQKSTTSTEHLIFLSTQDLDSPPCSPVSINAISLPLAQAKYWEGILDLLFLPPLHPTY